MAQPSLLIPPQRFSTGKLFAYSPQQGTPVELSVTRGTTAFRTNVSGTLESVASGIARLDYRYAGALQSCPALLVEPAATNLVLRSEEFDNVYWTKGRVTSTTNTSVSPNGTTTADTITDDTTASATHRVFSENVALVSGTSYSSSCFVKAGTSNRVEIRLMSNLEADIGIAATVFDLSNGTVISGSGRIENYGNGWFRCTNTGTSNTTGNGRVFIYLYNSANQRVYTGTATNTMFIWGAQLETGSVATSYIPTVAATATRNADVISLTGASGLIGQTEGALYAEVNFSRTGKGAGDRIMEFTNGTNVNRIILAFANDTSIITRVTAASVEQASFIATVSFGTLKIAFAYSSSGCVLYVNGVNTQSNLSAIIPATNQINIGFQGVTLASQLNDHIRCAAIYKERLTNSELAAITAL